MATPPTRLATDLPDAEPGEYRSLSGLALLALLLGLLSSAVLAYPLMLAVSAAAFGCGALALSRIRAADGAVAGAALARLGMALAVAFAVASLVRDRTRSEMLNAQADVSVRQWLGLLGDDRLDEARAMLTASAAQSMLPPREPGKDPLPVEKSEPIVMAKFSADPLVAGLRGKPLPGDLAAEAPDAPPERTGFVWNVVRHYRLEGLQGGPHLQVSLKRIVRVAGVEPSWKIERWQASPKPFVLASGP